MAHSSLQIVSPRPRGSAPARPRANETDVDTNVRTLRDVALALAAAAEALETSAEETSRHINLDEGIDLDHEVGQFESDLIRRALARTHGNQKRASVLLGLKPTTLNTKIKKYQISVEF